MPVVRGQPPEPVSGFPDSPLPRDFAFTLRLHRVEPCHRTISERIEHRQLRQDRALSMSANKCLAAAWLESRSIWTVCLTSGTNLF